MISRKHEDVMPQREHRASPVEEKLTTTASQGRAQQAPTSLPGWIAVPLCILGIAISLVAGSMVWWPLGWPFGVEMSFETVILLMGVLAIFGAVLLGFAFRAWWIGLLVPVVWLVGEFLGAVVRRLVDGWWPLGNEHFWDGQGLIIPVALVLLTPLGVSGSAGVIAFRRWWEMRQQQL